MRTAIEALQADPDLCVIPTIMLTTSRQEEDIMRSYKLGANAYIVKPVTLDQFVDAIRVIEDHWFQLVVLPSQA